MPLVPRSLRHALITGLVIPVVGLPSGAAAQATGTSAGVATHVAIRAVGPGEVYVSWSASSIRGVVDWEVFVTETTADGSTTHTFFRRPFTRGITVSDLPAGAAVHAAVATFSGRRPLNLSSPTPDVTVPMGLCGGAPGACVGADATQPLGAEQHIAQGFLHGLGLTSTGVAEMQALHPTSWRITEGSPSEMNGVRAYDAATTALLSDPWWETTYNASTGTAASPWQNWAAYRRFVVNEVRKRVADGNLPDYWDIQNEPDDPGFYNPAYPPTAALIKEQFNVAYTAIKSVLPDARIIGPSLGGFTLVGGPNHLGLLNFITYATAHNLHFAALSWHENNAANGTTPSLQLPVFADHVQLIRSALAASPVLARAQIFVNEFASRATDRLVGWDLGHVIALEQAGADEADRSCFEDCTNGADSLLDPTDEQTPRMTYWGRLAYAQMTGDRVDTITTQRDTTAMTVVDTATRTLTTVIARHHGCSVAGNSACPAGQFVSPAPSGLLRFAVKLPVGGRAGTATVSVTTLAATVSDSPNAPNASASSMIFGTDGQLAVPLQSLPDGAAYVVKVTW